MKSLEVFAGTQSFSNGLRRACTADITTLDILPRFRPTIRIDIMKWDYAQIPPGTFDIIWCSPPCTEYSSAKTRGARNLELADSHVRKCFEIIDYFKPKVWIIENPATGLLPRRMPGIRLGIADPSIADYCAYGKPYRKRTAFWSNMPFQLDMCSVYCPFIKDGRHISIVGGTGNNQSQVRNIWERDSIPDALIDAMVVQILGFCRRE